MCKGYQMCPLGAYSCRLFCSCLWCMRNGEQCPTLCCYLCFLCLVRRSVGSKYTVVVYYLYTDVQQDCKGALEPSSFAEDLTYHSYQWAELLTVCDHPFVAAYGRAGVIAPRVAASHTIAGAIRAIICIYIYIYIYIYICVRATRCVHSGPTPAACFVHVCGACAMANSLSTTRLYL